MSLNNRHICNQLPQNYLSLIPNSCSSDWKFVMCVLFLQKSVGSCVLLVPKCMTHITHTALLNCRLFHWICPSMEVYSIQQGYQKLTKMPSFKMNLPSTWSWWKEEIFIFLMFLIKMVSFTQHMWQRWIMFNNAFTI